MHSYFQGNLIRGQAAKPVRACKLGVGAGRPHGLHGRKTGRVKLGFGAGVGRCLFPPSISEASAGLDSNPESWLCPMSLSWWLHLSLHFLI